MQNKYDNEEIQAFHEASKFRRKFKEFDDQQKIKLKEFKQIWKLEDSKNRNLLSIIPWIAGLLIIVAIFQYIEKNDTKINQATTNDETIEKSIFKPLEPKELPVTSILTTSFDSESATNPFTMIADNKNYYVKLCDTNNNDQTVATFFIRAGETLQATVPSGNYKIKYGAGSDWYGEEELFGAFSQYGESETMVFSNYGYSSNGYTISFYRTVHGNLHTNRINRDAISQN